MAQENPALATGATTANTRPRPPGHGRAEHGRTAEERRRGTLRVFTTANLPGRTSWVQPLPAPGSPADREHDTLTARLGNNGSAPTPDGYPLAQHTRRARDSDRRGHGEHGSDTGTCTVASRTVSTRTGRGWNDVGVPSHDRFDERLSDPRRPRTQHRTLRLPGPVQLEYGSLGSRIRVDQRAGDRRGSTDGHGPDRRRISPQHEDAGHEKTKPAI